MGDPAHADGGFATVELDNQVANGGMPSRDANRTGSIFGELDAECAEAVADSLVQGWHVSLSIVPAEERRSKPSQVTSRLASAPRGRHNAGDG